MCIYIYIYIFTSLSITVLWYEQKDCGETCRPMCPEAGEGYVRKKFRTATESCEKHVISRELDPFKMGPIWAANPYNYYALFSLSITHLYFAFLSIRIRWYYCRGYMYDNFRLISLTNIMKNIEQLSCLPPAEEHWARNISLYLLCLVKMMNWFFFIWLCRGRQIMCIRVSVIL